MLQAPNTKHARYEDGAIAGVAGAVAAAFAATAAINYLAPLQDSLFSHLGYWSHGFIKLLSNYETEKWHFYQDFLERAAHSSEPYAIKWRMYAVGFASAAGGLVAGWHSGKPISDLDKISGNDLIRGRAAIKYFNRQSDGSGLELNNGLQLDVNKESEHLLLSGGTGAGKSVTATAILVPALERGDRVILINYKGLTEKFPVILNTEDKHNYNAIILCPFDRRSAVWAIWQDVTTKSQAREYGARVIPDSKDPVWSNSARFIMTGILMYLINNHSSKGEVWTWGQFGELCEASRERLVEVLTEHYPEGLRAIKDEGKTSDSVMMNFAAFAAPIIDLAEAWGDRKTGFSIEAWVNNPNSKIRTVILQLSSEFKVLAQTFNQSVLNQVGTYLTRLSDVPAHKNALWIYADEFPRLGKSEVFEELFSVGRSKSMRIAVAIQDLGQLKKEYGIDIAEGWISSIGMKILGRSSATGARWTSEMCGKAVYAQLQDGRTDTSGKRRATYGSPQTYDVFTAEDASNELGIFYSSYKQTAIDFLRTFGLKSLINKIKPDGVRMLLHGVKGAVLLIDFKFTILPTMRAETVLAGWAKGGFGYAQSVKIEDVMEDSYALEVAPILTSALPPLEVEVPSYERSEEIVVLEEKQVIEEISVDDLSMFDDLESRETHHEKDEIADEVMKEAAGEVLDNLTDSHLSLAIEVADLAGELMAENYEKQDEMVTTQTQITAIETTKKPSMARRYVSKKDMLQR